MSNKKSVVLARPARINGKKHLVTGKAIDVDAKIAEELQLIGALQNESAGSGEVDPDDQALSKMKKSDLLAIADQLSIQVPEKATNADIVTLIENARSAE